MGGLTSQVEEDLKNHTNLKDELKYGKLPESGSGNENDENNYEYVEHEQQDEKSEEEHVPENDIMDKEYAVENEMENYEKRDEFKQLNEI